MDSFSEFWSAYPRKVGKLIAMEKYRKALKLATHEDIMAGVQRYIETKPDDIDWCHPKTWLQQGRWMDEPDTDRRMGERRNHDRRQPGAPHTSQRGIVYPCPHTPACLKTWACGQRQLEERKAS